MRECATAVGRKLNGSAACTVGRVIMRFSPISGRIGHVSMIVGHVSMRIGCVSMRIFDF